MVVVARARERRDPVTPEWKAKVRAELAKRGRGAFTRLAEEIGASTGKLGDLLDDGERSPSTSPLVARINEYFGWPAPLPPSTSRDAAELQYIFDRIDEKQKEALLRAAEVIAGKSGEDARQMLIAMLRLAGGTAQNDKDKN